MHAHDRFLPGWFNRIPLWLITLPRFQRFMAWGHGEVSGHPGGDLEAVRGIPGPFHQGKGVGENKNRVGVRVTAGGV
jgi:hypothetical protein